MYMLRNLCAIDNEALLLHKPINITLVNFTKTTANRDNELTTTEPTVHCYGKGMCA